MAALNQARSEGLIAPSVDTFILRRFLTGALGWSNFWYRNEGPMPLEAIAEQALYMVLTPQKHE